MTPDQVQKDLELVLELAEERAIAVDTIFPAKGIYNAQAAIARLRGKKLVAVEEAPEGVPQIMYGEKLWQTGHLDHWDCDPDPGLFGKPNTLHVWRYAGTVKVDENGKVEG